MSGAVERALREFSPCTELLTKAHQQLLLTCLHIRQAQHEVRSTLPVVHNASPIVSPGPAPDDGALIDKLWLEHRIKPVIDIKNMWKDGEETRLVSGQKNVVHDYKGQIYCHCPQTGGRREMAYGGFEETRGTLKYRCPAQHYGLECRGRDQCPARSGIRIPLKEDSRVFTPVARSSYSWRRLYAKRTAVERVNSRLDVSFGLEHHFVRGLSKMKLKCTLALSVMLAMALGRIKEKRREHLRSLVRAA